MGITTGVSGDEIKKQANRQNPPEFDSDFSGQPAFESDFFNTDMPTVTSATSTGEFSGFDNVGVGAQFGVKPGTAGTPPMQAGVISTLPGDNNAQQEEAKKTDYWDKFFKAVWHGSKVIFSFTKQLLVSMRNRNIEDWAILSDTWLKIGGGMAGLGFVGVVAGTVGNISLLKLGGLGGGALLSGLVVVVFGMGGLGVSLFLRTQGGEYSETGGSFEQLGSFDSMKDAVTSTTAGGFATSTDEDDEDYSFDSDEDDEDDEDYSYSSIISKLGYSEDGDDGLFDDDVEEVVENVQDKTHDLSYLVDGVDADHKFITRQFLWDTFKNFFPRLTTDFDKLDSLDLNSETVLAIGAKLNKAIKVLVPKADDVETECLVTEVMESKFSYTVKFNRPKVKVQLKAFEDELINYFKDDAFDDSFKVTLSVLSDDYYLVVPKNNTNIVTLGDAFSSSKVANYYLNDKITIPIIVGVTQFGDIIMKNAFSIPSMAIIGTPRGGKSSYVNSILFSMVTMCTPEDVIFIVIDPKESMLFKVFSYLPHVVGLHGSSDAIGVLTAVLNEEGGRRKKLMSESGVENIKELRGKNIKLPVLYVVIDEMVSLMEEAKSDGTDKELKGLMDMIITKLPSAGVGLMVIPHRTTGTLPVTTRKNIAFKAVVRADRETVKDELSDKNWNTPLPNPGDLAIISVGEQGAQFAKSVVPVDPRPDSADKDSRDLMIAIARAWYKIGVDMPDTQFLGMACNRDEEKIKEELEIDLNTNRIQYEID